MRVPRPALSAIASIGLVASGLALAAALPSGAGAAGTNASTAISTTTTPTGTTPAPPAPIVPAGVSVLGVDLSGLTADAALAKVRQAFFATPLHLHVGPRPFTPPATWFKIAAPLQAAVSQALVRTVPGDIPVAVRYDVGQVHRLAATLVERTAKTPIDAFWRWGASRPYAVREQDGKRARQIDVERAIIAGIEHPTARVGIVVRRAVWHATGLASNLGPAIVISRSGHYLKLYGVSRRGRTIIRHTFQVATGQSAYPTPRGFWSVVQMWRNPWWYPPDSPWAKGLKPIPPGPGNPLGTRWMGLSASGVGIHGTPDDASIGYSASHGCIRMHVPDAEYLFTQVSIGVPVLVI